MEIVAELFPVKIVWAIPVVVFIIAGLLFTYSVKASAKPPFDKLSSAVSDERKQQQASKKRKTKEKKSTSSTANGHVVNENKNTPVKVQKKSPSKEPNENTKQQVKKQEVKQVEKKNEVTKKNLSAQKSIEEIKNKKNKKASANEKPLDYDEGNWETVPTKADKKKKIDSPAKKDKKEKKKLENEKLVKEVVNKELREKEKEMENEVSEPEIKESEEPKEKLVEILIEDAPAPTVEEKKDKKKTEKKIVKKENSIEKAEKKKDVDPPISKQIAEAMKEVTAPTGGNKKQIDGGVAFDELGDVWTEAKVPKKSKKKARRDN